MLTNVLLTIIMVLLGAMLSVGIALGTVMLKAWAETNVLLKQINRLQWDQLRVQVLGPDDAVRVIEHDLSGDQCEVTDSLP